MMTVAVQHDLTAENERLMQRTAMAAVITGGVLVVIKTVAYLMTGSIALLASLVDSAFDIFVSFVNLLAIRHALTPADNEHRFGHGKAEPLAGLIQGAFVCGSTLLLLTESVKRLISPQPIEHGIVGIVVTVVSTIVCVLLVLQQHYVVKRTGSIAINADYLHYLADVLINIGVLIAIVVATSFNWLSADPIMGILVALALAWSVLSIIRQSYDQLMDRELPDDERERIKALVLSHQGVLGLHDLRTRAAGTHAFIQAHIELDPSLTLFAAHKISDDVEKAVRSAFPLAEIIIHQDPKGYEEPEALAKS